jgi:exopolysaccharide biosynthesis operon protein EpsL
MRAAQASLPQFRSSALDLTDKPLVGLEAAFLAALLISTTNNVFANPVIWPRSGEFSAYPVEESEQRLRFYGAAEFVDDDNLFRVSDQAPFPVAGIDERGDRYLKLSAGLSGSLKMSRQQLRLDLHVDHYTFDNFSFLDEWLYAGNANWQWELGTRWKGELGYAGGRDYPDFSELQYASDDIVTHQYGHVRIDWQALQRIEIRTLFEGTQYEHAAESQAELNNRVAAGTLGLFYSGKVPGSIGVQYKLSDGKYPNREAIGAVTVDNGYRENESSMVLSKPIADKFGADLRIGYTQRRHDEVAERDFDGMTGRASLRYAPAAKVLIDFAVYSELQAVEDLSASYAVVRGFNIEPSWAPTSKWVVQAAYLYNRRTLEGNPGFVLTDSAPREDLIHAARVGVGYQPNRFLKAALSFEHGTRSSNVVGADYDYNLASLRVSASL